MALTNTINTYNAYVATGPVQAMTNKEFVADAYAKLLNLKGAFNNAEGRIKYWTDKLDAGTLTKANFAQAFMNEATTSQGSLVSNAEFQYNKDVVAAVEAKDATNTSIAAIEEASSKIPPVDPDYTKTFMLTEGRDNIKGNAANNLFDATAGQNNAGAISNAFATGDKLDGMGGSNKLQATIMKDYSIKDGGNDMGIRATTDNIQQVNFEAMGSTGFSANDAVVVQATKMANVEQYWSDFSDSNLKITDINLNGANLNITKDVTFGMKDTAHKAGLTALFDSQSLKKSGETKANSSLSIEIADVSTETPLTPLANVNMNLTFSLGGTVYTLENLKADGGTYAGLITAVQTALAAKGLGSLDVKANGDYTSVTVANNTVNLPFTATKLLITDPAGAVFSNVSFQQSAIAPVAGGFLVAGTALPLDPSTSSTMIESNLILDNAGRGSLGGDVHIGGQSDSNLGVEKFNVTVDRASKISELLQSTPADNNSTGNGNASKLKQIDIASKGANGSLTINKIDANLDLVNATGFAGADLKMGGTTALTAVSNLAQFNSAGTATNVTLNATYDGAGRASDKQAFTINTGSGNDAITASVVGTSTSGSTKASLTVNSTGGNNTVKLSSTNVEVNKATVTTGAGTDTVTGGATHLTANTGAGNDVIYAENTGAKATATLAAVSSFSTGTNSTGAAAAAAVKDVELVYGREVQVTVAMPGDAVGFTNGFEVKAKIEAASGNYLTTERDIYNAAAKAINADETVNKLVKAHVTSTGNLVVEYIIDGTTLPANPNLVKIEILGAAWDATATNEKAIVASIQKKYQNSLITSAELATGYAAEILVADNATVTAGTVSSFVFNETTLTAGDFITVTIDGVSATTTTLVTGAGGTENISINGVTYTVDNTTAAAVTVTALTSGPVPGAGVFTAQDQQLTPLIVTGAYTAGTLLSNGGNSTTNGVNIVNAGQGDDVIVLSSNAVTSDTVKFDAGSIGNDTIVHFKVGALASGGDKLDFTAWMNNVESASTSVDSQKAIATTLDITGVASYTVVNGNTVSVINDFAEAGTATWAGLTAANFLLAIQNDLGAVGYANITDTTLELGITNLNLVGATVKTIVMVENDKNAGEYKVFEVTGNKTTSDFTSATLVGTVDFGVEQVFTSVNFA